MWVIVTKIFAGILTIIVLFLLIKELRTTIKRSNAGETGDGDKRWDID
ncbi:MAG: hypothetical protein GXO02_02505 [Epsilonproteobacteria bacterium]|jgi:hypothetical protein|nr:hypothetical protein [Campylobacterota bacterium]